MTAKRDDSDADSIAGLLEATEWDYRPKDDGVGLLSPMSRYFSGFPWDGHEEKDEPSTPVYPLSRSDAAGPDFSDI